MYALAMMPLIFRLDEQALVTQVWFADDATANGKIKKIREWWNLLNDISPGYGYYVNAQKSWLIVKDESFTEAKEIFEGSNVQITTQGQRHLGAALGSSTFVESYVSDKVKSWVDKIIMLTEIAKSQPHAAYAALSHSLIHKWTYIARTILDISDLFTPLEDALRYHLLPAIMGRDAFSDSERELFSFPTRLGGLGIINLVKESNDFYLASKEITASLSLLILQQNKQCSDTVSSQQNQIKQTLKKRKRQKQNDQSRHSERRPGSSTSACYGIESRKGCFAVVECHPPGLTKVCSPQRSVMGCALFQVWLASQASPHPLSLREDLFC